MYFSFLHFLFLLYSYKKLKSCIDGGDMFSFVCNIISFYGQQTQVFLELKKTYFYHYFCSLCSVSVFIGLNFWHTNYPFFFKLILFLYHLYILEDKLVVNSWFNFSWVVLPSSTDFGADFNFAITVFIFLLHFTFLANLLFQSAGISVCSLCMFAGFLLKIPVSKKTCLLDSILVTL